MSKIAVSIKRANIYSIAEGISISIAQHNGGTPTYEQLWASADESRKLDIYYREAISDLERHLTEWITDTSSQFVLTADGTDYLLELRLSPHWPERMQGLLANKIQDYLVHAVTAGWLNDFQGLETKQDYQVMAAQDITDIRGIIYLRQFRFKEKNRTTEDVTKVGIDENTPYCKDKMRRHRDNDWANREVPAGQSERTEDSSVKADSVGFTPDARTDDGSVKADSVGFTPANRTEDVSIKDGSPSLNPDARTNDGSVKADSVGFTPDARTDDGSVKADSVGFTPSERTDDGSVKADSVGFTPSERTDDGSVKADSVGFTPDARTDDGSVKADSVGFTPDARTNDGTRKAGPASLDPGARKDDDCGRNGRHQDDAGGRNEDNARQCLHGDWSDWTGTGIAFRDRMPHQPVQPLDGAGGVQFNRPKRIRFGYGYTPSIIKHHGGDTE